MKYAVEVAKAGSLNKASEKLFVALPNISRSIKELESDLGITIFERSAKGVTPTVEGTEFINYAKGILDQIEQVEELYKKGPAVKQRFSVSVPRACYISDAFAEFSKSLTRDPAEIFYKETNTQKTINNVLDRDYKLGIIRYSENFDKSYKAMLEDKGLNYELIAEFKYKLIVSADSPLAAKESISYDDLSHYIEIAHADLYVPTLPFAKAVKEELPGSTDRKIFIFERASQFDLLSKNPETFMWVSPTPDELLEKYGLVLRACDDNSRVYKDVLIYKNGYKLTELDKSFITALCESKRRYL